MLSPGKARLRPRRLRSILHVRSVEASLRRHDPDQVRRVWSQPRAGHPGGGTL